MYQITINKIDGKVPAYAVKIGCQTYTFLTAQAASIEVATYMALSEADQREAEESIGMARGLYDKMQETTGNHLLDDTVFASAAATTLNRPRQRPPETAPCGQDGCGQS
jgi:hypothetical protein